LQVAGCRLEKSGIREFRHRLTGNAFPACCSPLTARGFFRPVSGLRYPVILLVIISLVLLSLTSCRRKEPAPPPPPPTVTVARPLQREVTDFLETTGTTQAVQTVQLRARVAGYLEKILFKDGQFVNKGQLLFLIQQNTYQANLEQAEGAVLLQKTQLDYAATEFTRYSKLFAQNAASQIDVDNWRNQRDSAQANLITAQAKRDLAKLDLAYTEVRAPFDGRIDRRLADPGNLVGSGEVTVLAAINQINPIYVYFTVSDAELGRLMSEAGWRPGISQSKKWPVYMGLGNEQGYVRSGLLDFASISLTATTGTLLMRAVFDNPQGTVLPGLYARIHVPLQKMTALLVPQEAVGSDQRGSYVLLVNEQDTVVRHSVKTGPVVQNMRAIREGITANQWVVVSGLQKAVPGRPVTPQKQTLKESASTQSSPIAGPQATPGTSTPATPNPRETGR
jgi:RND family efflux transporter MFP subunit